MERHVIPLVFLGFSAIATPLLAAPTAGENAAAVGEASTSATVDRMSVTGVGEQAAMVVVGTALIGLAAAVRRAT